MKHDELIGLSGSSVSVVLTTIQTNETFQLIEFIFSIICFLLTISYTLWKWYRKAKKDGKITADEVEELFDNLENNLKK